MGFSVTDLTEATLRVKPTLASHVSWGQAAEKAIKSKGIFNQRDINRRVKDVLKELRRLGKR